MNIDEFAA